MKRTIYTLLCFLMPALLLAQAPEKLNYQAIARNASGAILANQNISLKLSVHQSTTGGTVVYSELHLATTNQFGLFTVKIGSPTSVLTGAFSNINWGKYDYFQPNSTPLQVPTIPIWALHNL